MDTMSRGRLAIRPFSRLGAYFIEFACDIWALREERRALGALDDATLKDIGLSRADVERELAKPFWRR
jgi:uncharacterized protein YjiS (DUF1127 family)